MKNSNIIKTKIMILNKNMFILKTSLSNSKQNLMIINLKSFDKN